jgi:hypothetical protein
LLALLWLFVASTLVTAADDKCAACGNRLGAQVYLFTRRGRDQKVSVCSACAKLETACYICDLPVKDRGMRLSDGRMLCEEDMKVAVLTQEDAASIFDDVKREVQSILSQLGSLPHNNINLILETKAHLDKTGANVISTHDDSLLMGLTRTIGRGEGKFDHTIYILYGLTRERMIAVSAHEYGHTWLHENVQRKLNHDTVEGFCDWMAYKIIQPKSPSETKVLYQSNYSQGQSRAFIAAEKEHGFYHVMNWVKNGVDPEVDAEHPERILVLRDRSGRGDSLATPEFVSIPVAPRANPTNLVLKGLSGPASRRFALINDATLMANEQGKVRLFDSNVVLRCLEIRNDSVRIQVAGEIEPRTLTLSAVR